MMQRPLRDRQIRGSWFGEPVVIRTRVQTTNEFGESVESFMEMGTRCSSNPISADDERLGDLQESGVRLESIREFYTIEEMDVNNRDEFLWNKERYVAYHTANWQEFNVTLAVRKEDQ